MLRRNGWFLLIVGLYIPIYLAAYGPLTFSGTPAFYRSLLALMPLLAVVAVSACLIAYGAAQDSVTNITQIFVALCAFPVSLVVSQECFQIAATARTPYAVQFWLRHAYAFEAWAILSLIMVPVLMLRCIGGALQTGRARGRG